jgi:hypothetical protein
MTETRARLWAKLKRPHILILAFLLLLIVAGGTGYLILLRPRSILVRWAEAALPDQITMICMGPFPEEEFQQLRKATVRYIVSLLDPQLPYEKELIEREKVLAEKYQMTLKVFPMASIFDRQIFPDYLEQQQKAVDFLKHLDSPAYMHCYPALPPGSGAESGERGGKRLPRASPVALEVQVRTHALLPRG